MHLPLVDLKAQYLSIKDEIDAAVARVLLKGMYVMGEEVEAFEEKWAWYCEAKYAVAVSSGTDALYLTFKALSEPELHSAAPPATAVPVRTFVATAEGALRAGCPVSLYDGTNHGPARVVVTVNLYGEPLPLGTPNVGGFTVEDAAHSHGVPLRGNVACYSFYPTKNLGAFGQAGAVVTNNADIAALVRVLRNHGESGGRFRHVHLSGNYRMDELQAAVLRAKLPHLDGWNKRRREIAAYYTAMFSGMLTVRPPEDHPRHVYHIYAVEALDRDLLASTLAGKGVQTSVHYPVPLHLQPCLSHLGYRKGDFLEAEKWANTTLSLPVYPEMTDQQVSYVTECVRGWVHGT